MNIKDCIAKACEFMNISVSENVLNSLEIYAKELIDYNEKVNLTALTDKNDIAVKHFVDSMALLKYCDIPENAKLIDVGTGAGFPGMVLKICRKDINLTLLDATAKKLEFLRVLSENLNLNVDIAHARAEILAKNKDYRESYDFATARAVAKLISLSEYVLPYVKVGGTFACMKGPSPQQEIDEAQSHIKNLGGEIADVKYFELPGNLKRSIIIINKISETPKKYPRNNKLIKNM